MTGSGFLEPALWYAQLPVLYAAAGALITDPAGQVLVVKPNYRPGWGLPGGVCEHGEAPHDTCAREVLEEVGLTITVGSLLVIHWQPPEGDRPNPNICLIFDGGSLADPAGITLQREELDDYRFIEPAEAAAYLPPATAGRIPAALEARSSGIPAYLHPHAADLR
jgi:8-oxo-dGTP diphosphatase